MMAVVENAGASFVPLVDVLRTADSNTEKLPAKPRSQVDEQVTELPGAKA